MSYTRTPQIYPLDLANLADVAKLIFIDIETASVHARFEELSPVLQKHWRRRHELLSRQNPLLPEDPAESFPQYAGVYAEFARVVCIGAGSIVKSKDGGLDAQLKVLMDADEKTLLELFSTKWLNTWFEKGHDRRFCGHNIKEFDMPFLARRFLANGMAPVPAQLQTYDKKPWEIPYVDTMELWRFGDVKSFTKLELIGELLGVASPKCDIDGAEVGRVFWVDKDYERIKRYCLDDVEATMQILLQMFGHPLATRAPEQSKS